MVQGQTRVQNAARRPAAREAVRQRHSGPIEIHERVHSGKIVACFYFAKLAETTRYVMCDNLCFVNQMPIEEIILEAVDKNSKNNFSRLLVKRRSCDGVYFCQLFLRSSEAAAAGEKSNDANDVQFKLGMSSDAER
jgi:hypothetical protein